LELATGVEEFRVCPLPMVSAQSLELQKLYQHYKRGHLLFPNAKSIYHQPNAYKEAMELLERVNA